MWTKKLSRTDAQQKTAGYKVPYLRLTKAKNPFDNQTWFRGSMLVGEKWTKGLFGQHQVEECHISADVEIGGQYKGKRPFLVTHDSTRQSNNNTPNTWLHYDAATLADLNTANHTGSVAKFEKTAAGYKLTIG